MITCPFDLTNKKEIIKFKEIDPYNSENTVEGYVNRRQGQLYGSLWITKVNGKLSKQIIYSAPKQHYPFDKENNWKFPECDYVDIFEKLDGTCIVSYVYKDKKGNVFLTYKTRLRPFLGKGKFGNFFEMWNEILKKYPEITNYTFDEYHNCVFELYGKRNKILVDYEVPLDTRLIFTINASSGQIYPPNKSVPSDKVPMLKCEGMFTGWNEYNNQGKTDQYLKVQQTLELELKIDEVNKIIRGKEGHVWYFMKDGYAVQIKCKPPSILKYHWSSDAIPYESIYTTCINAFENFDNVTIGNLKELLSEEFEEDKIEKSIERIKKVLTKVTFEKKLQYQIVEKYKKLGIDINKDKGSVMRYFAKEYDKRYAQTIFTLLNAYVNPKVKS